MAFASASVGLGTSGQPHLRNGQTAACPCICIAGSLSVQRGAAPQRRQQGHHQRRRRRQRGSPRAAAAADIGDQDSRAAQRAELGARVVRHLAGIEEVPELADAVRLLPLRIEPPRAWHTLTAGVAQQGAAALRAALAPRRQSVPSFHTLAHCGCRLTCSPTGRRFRARPINLMLALLFEQVPAACAVAGLPPVACSRWDLHHGHLFYSPPARQLGVLLHAKEYPASHPERFDVHLGNCQAGSSLEFEEAGMDARNLLWLGGRLACLDMSAPALAPLVMPGLEVARTVLEADLGLPLADINYFAELAGRKPAERLFVCLPDD